MDRILEISITTFAKMKKPTVVMGQRPNDCLLDEGLVIDTSGGPKEKTHDGTDSESSTNAMQTLISLSGRSYESIPSDIGVEYGSTIKNLDLSHNHLTNLNGIEYFSNLEELYLDNNELQLPELPYFPKLRTLTLNKNTIEDLKALLEILSKQTPNLTYLSLLGNKACPNELSQLNSDEEDYSLYRYEVINKIQNLKFLDSKPVKLIERKEAGKRAKYQDTITLTHETTEKFEKSDDTNCSPLPKNEQIKGKTVMKKKKTNYIGKHSEGNRFIVNKDL